MRIAVMDYGSTSFHALVVDVDEDGALRKVCKRREMLHLAAVVAKHGRLPEPDALRSIRAARVLRRFVDVARPQRVIAVATSALRDAANGGDLIERLSVATRCRVRRLEGREEARLVHTGIRGALDLDGTPLLVCDLGGGSLELALGCEDDLGWDVSLPLGAARLTATFVEGDPMSRDELSRVSDLVRTEVLQATPPAGAPYPPCVATGGTAHALARLTAARRGISDLLPITGSVLPAAELYRWADVLTTLTRAERLKLPGVRARRVDVLPVGAVVLAGVVEALDLPGLVVSEWGLREGAVLTELEAKRLDLVAAGL